MIERLDGQDISIGDCTKVSRHVSALIEVEEPLVGSFALEVSSPGIDRPLVKPEDFLRFLGKRVRLKLAPPGSYGALLAVLASPHFGAESDAGPTDGHDAQPGNRIDSKASGPVDSLDSITAIRAGTVFGRVRRLVLDGATLELPPQNLREDLLVVEFEPEVTAGSRKKARWTRTLEGQNVAELRTLWEFPYQAILDAGLAPDAAEIAMLLQEQVTKRASSRQDVPETDGESAQAR